MPNDVPDFLIKRPGRRSSPYDHWKKYKDKDVVLCLNENVTRWDAHPEGIIVEKNNELFLNGNKKVFGHERER